MTSNGKLAKLTTALALAGLVTLGTSCEKLKSRDQLNKGVQAFKSAQYPEAVEHFKTAVELDPSFPVARLYLATAYMQQYIPGADSPENNQMAQAAHDQFMKVLDSRRRTRWPWPPLPRFISIRRSGTTRSSGMRSWSPSIRTKRMPITA